MVTLSEYLNSSQLTHLNKKLRWSTLPNGNLRLANNSTKKPISFEFSPSTKVKKIHSNTSMYNKVYCITINNKKVTFVNLPNNK